MCSVTALTLIEWADRYPDLIPKGATWISLETAGENVRKDQRESRSVRDMRILALELSTEQGSVAWIENDQRRLTRTFANNRKHSGLFFESLQDCLKQNGQPDAIVVGLGPGSYAGVRIAIATAVGVRAASTAKLVGLPSICAIETDAQDYCVIGDARRDSFFFGRISDGKLAEGPSLHSNEELAARLVKVDLPIFVSESLPLFPRATLAWPSAENWRDWLATKYLRSLIPNLWNRFIFANLISLCQKFRYELQQNDEFRNGLPLLG